MVQIKRSEMRVIEEAFGMEQGYVLDFNDRTMAEWFEDEFGLDLEAERYCSNGGSKARRLRTFFDVEEAPIVARVLRRLWDYRLTIGWPPTGLEPQAQERIRSNLFDIVHRIEGAAPVPATDALVTFVHDETLDELVKAIRRDIEAGKPSAALDRLHTYSMKKFAHLLALHDVPVSRDEPLHSRVGKYVKRLEGERQLRSMTRQILKNTIGIFQEYNDVRNNASFAHDNEIVGADEARFIFETVISMLRFVRSVEADSFERSAA